MKKQTRNNDKNSTVSELLYSGLACTLAFYRLLVKVVFYVSSLKFTDLLQITKIEKIHLKYFKKSYLETKQTEMKME